MDGGKYQTGIHDSRAALHRLESDKNQLCVVSGVLQAHDPLILAIKTLVQTRPEERLWIGWIWGAAFKASRSYVEHRCPRIGNTVK